MGYALHLNGSSNSKPKRTFGWPKRCWVGLGREPTHLDKLRRLSWQIAL